MFTDREKAAIEHRLGVPDSLADSLSETHSEDEVIAASESIERRLRSGDFSELSEVERDVLIDCIEGSTWFGCIDDADVEDQKKAAGDLTRAAKKIENLLGITGIMIPKY